MQENFAKLIGTLSQLTIVGLYMILEVMHDMRGGEVLENSVTRYSDCPDIVCKALTTASFETFTFEI